MFVEGKIDREFLKILREAGFDIVWECKSKKDAVEHGYGSYTRSDTDTIARVFINTDMETYLLPLLFSELMDDDETRMKLLPLLATTCTIQEIRDWAIKELEHG